MQAAPTQSNVQAPEPSLEINLELDNQIVQAITTANTTKIEECLARISKLQDAQERISRAFLSTVAEAPEAALKILIETKQVNFRHEDEINERNCLHMAAICGRTEVLRLGLAGDVDVHAIDVYGRIPLHYASMHGHVGQLPGPGQLHSSHTRNRTFTTSMCSDLIVQRGRSNASGTRRTYPIESRLPVCVNRNSRIASPTPC